MQWAKRRAFTLVEMLVVMAVLGCLIMIAAPALFRAKVLSRVSMCKGNLAKLGDSVWLFVNANNDALPLSSSDAIATTTIKLNNAGNGLGVLYERGYQTEWRLFYCPDAYQCGGTLNRQDCYENFRARWDPNNTGAWLEGDYALGWSGGKGEGVPDSVKNRGALMRYYNAERGIWIADASASTALYQVAFHSGYHYQNIGSLSRTVTTIYDYRKASPGLNLNDNGLPSENWWDYFSKKFAGMVQRAGGS